METATVIRGLYRQDTVATATELFWTDDAPVTNATDDDFRSANVTSASASDLTRTVCVALILGSISIVTTAGNVLVLLAVGINRHLRSTTHYFIANLAVADLLVGTTVLPFSASLEVLDYWAFGQVFCDVWAALDVLCCTASIISLCVISIDRYVGVTRPLQHSIIISEARAGYIIVVVWVLSLAISIAPLFGWKEPPAVDPTVCEVTKQTGYVLFSVAGSFYIPLTIILVVYFRVYREALSQSRFLLSGVKVSRQKASARATTAPSDPIALRVHTGQNGGRRVSQQVTSSGSVVHPSPQHLQFFRMRHSSVQRPSLIPSISGGAHDPCSSSRRQSTMTQGKITLAHKIAKFHREKKAAKTLGIVVGVFVICWFPFFLVLPLEALCKTCITPPLLFKVIFWLGYCNSLINPVIYACSSREFKRAFVQILRCQFGRKSRGFLRDSFLTLRSVPSNNLPADDLPSQGPPTPGTLQAAHIYATRVFGFSKPRTSLDGLRSVVETVSMSSCANKSGTGAIFRHRRQPKCSQSQQRRRRQQHKLDCNYYYVEYDSPVLKLKEAKRGGGMGGVGGGQCPNTNHPSVSTISDDGSAVREISDEENSGKENSAKDKDATHS